MSKTCLALAASLSVAFAAALLPVARAADEKPARPAAPAFKVKDSQGKERTLEEFKGKWVVVEWVNPSCPFVKKFYAPGFLQAMQKKYADKGVVWLLACSTNPDHKDYMTAEQWKTYVAEAKVPAAAVLLDADGTMGKAYGATRTPEMRVICPQGTIVYTGAIDDNPAAKADPATARNYVAEVLDAVLAGKDAPLASAPAYGCSVKYAK